MENQKQQMYLVIRERITERLSRQIGESDRFRNMSLYQLIGMLHLVAGHVNLSAVLDSCSAFGRRTCRRRPTISPTGPRNKPASPGRAEAHGGGPLMKFFGKRKDKPVDLVNGALRGQVAVGRFTISRADGQRIQALERRDPALALAELLRVLRIRT